MAHIKASTKEKVTTWQEMIDQGDRAYRLANYGEAEKFYEEALAEAEKGEQGDPRLETSLSTLAWFYRDQGRYSEAEPLYRQVVKLWEEVLGPDHPSLGASCYKLAEFYFVQGRADEALPFYERSLSIREKKLGKRNLDVADTAEHLARAHLCQGRYQDAIELYEKALEIRQGILGSKHPAVAYTHLCIAAAYLCQGKSGEASMMASSAKRVFGERAQKVPVS